MIFFLYLISLFYHHLIVIEYSVSFLQPPVRTYRCSCRQSQVLHAGLTRKHIYSQRLLTFSATSLNRLHLGSYQSHRSNDHVLSAYFCAAIIGSSFQQHPLSLCRTCVAVSRASADAFSSSLPSPFCCLWSLSRSSPGTTKKSRGK